MSVTFRPTVAADIPALTSEPLPFRIRGLTAVIDDKVVGVAGVGFMPDGVVCGFAQLTDDLRRHRVALHRAALRFLADVRASGIRELVTLADPSIERAEPWLRRLGFEPIERNGERIYRWPIQ